MATIEDNESQRSYDYFSSADDEDLYIGGKAYPT